MDTPAAEPEPTAQPPLVWLDQPVMPVLALVMNAIGALPVPAALAATAGLGFLLWRIRHTRRLDWPVGVVR